jgi:hypothetical protein
MRHLFVPAGAIAVALWLGPAFARDRMPDSKKIATVIVVTAVFLVIWLAMNRRAKAKKRDAEAASSGSRYGFLGHVIPVRRGK